MKKISLAGCVLLNSDNEVLLLHRNTPKRVQWETPGGKVEEGEAPEDTLYREIKEELGIDVNIMKKLGEKDFTEDDFVMNYTWYLVEITKGEPKVIETDKFDDLQYFNWEKLTDMHSELSANTKNLVDAYNNKLFEMIVE